jgi:class 3 adenylate cyclase/tetratricopeptide (TPR) repeat protein
MSIPHDPLIQATIAYAVPKDVRAATWDAIDTSRHASLPHLVEAMRASVAKEHDRVRAAMSMALDLVSADAEPELYLIMAINDARFLATGRSPKAGVQRLAAEEHRFDAASSVVRMTARWRLGVLHLNAGQLAEAFREFTAARPIAIAEGWEYDAALLAAELASVCLETGDPVKAIAHYEEAYGTLSRLGDTSYTEIILMNLALAHGRVGALPTAERLMEDALARYRNDDELDKYVPALLNMASMKMKLGKIDEARAIYEEILKGTESRPIRTERVRAFIGTASVFNASGDRPAALEYLDRARSVASELGQAVAVLDIDAKRADVLRDLGNRRDALDLLRATFAEFTAHTYTQLTIEVGNQLERWLVEDGYRAEAYDVLKLCADLQRDVYTKESERALHLSTVRQTMEAERRDLTVRDEERRALLQRVLPLPIADRIMAGERRIAEQIDLVGILFADIVGFTQSSAGKTPSDVLELLEDLFREIDNIVAANRCEKIKCIGDSYMATSATSAGHDSADPAESVVRLARCGLDIMDLMRTPRHAHVQLRIGMHAGPVVAGVMDGMRLAYDMWGDTVNVASRMEGTSAPGRFQTTSAVVELLGAFPEFRVIPRDAIDVKGRGSMSTFWVERATMT